MKIVKPKISKSNMAKLDLSDVVDVATSTESSSTKSLVFDSGPIISLTTTNLLWILEELKTSFRGEFYIPSAVKEEIIDYPLTTKKFKLEALQVNREISKGTLKLVGSDIISKECKRLGNMANSIFKAKTRLIRIVHPAEMEVIAAALKLGSLAIVVDERTTRLLIEDSAKLQHMLEKKLKTKVEVDQKQLDLFLAEVRGIKVLRSIELAIIAFEKGLLDKYLINRPDAKKMLIESFLWSIKLHGCAISRRELDQIVKLEID